MTKDVILNARVVQAMDNIHLFTINVFPNDVTERDHIDVWIVEGMEELVVILVDLFLGVQDLVRDLFKALEA